MRGARPLGMQAEAQHIDRRREQRRHRRRPSAARSSRWRRSCSSDGRRRAPDRARAPPAPDRSPCAPRRARDRRAGARGRPARSPPRPAARCGRARELSSCSARRSTMSRLGLRAAGLEEAQMLGRDLGIAGEVELAQAPALAPRAQMIADRAHCLGHAADDSAAARPLPITSGVSGERTSLPAT